MSADSLERKNCEYSGLCLDKVIVTNCLFCELWDKGIKKSLWSVFSGEQHLFWKKESQHVTGNWSHIGIS